MRSQISRFIDVSLYVKRELRQEMSYQGHINQLLHSEHITVQPAVSKDFPLTPVESKSVYHGRRDV